MANGRLLVDAVVLLSGGMDSAVMLSIAKTAYKNVHTIFYSYHQTTEFKEQKCAIDLSRHYNVSKVNLVRLDYLSKISTSSLLSKQEIEGKKYKVGVDYAVDSVPATYVPFRNSQFILMAAAYAESNRLRNPDILIGAAHGSVYPDCQPEFFKHMNKLLNYAGKPGEVPQVVTPLLYRDKTDIVRLGLQGGVPFELTWSCYEEESYACGICDSCVLRLEGFKALNAKDPISYVK